MLMEVKNQFKISFLSVKYALMREMLNKTTFITNVLFMILNNASFIIQWIVLFSLKDNVGGYTFDQEKLTLSSPSKSVKIITQAQLEEIAKIKMDDLNATTLEAAVKMIKGSCRAMGVTVKEG